MKKILGFVFLTIIGFQGFSQNDINEGVITTLQKMQSDNEEVNATLSDMGNVTSTTYFKADKTRVEMFNPMTGDMIAITDGKTKQMITFMNNPMVGKKYIKSSMDISEEDLNKVSVKKGDKTKTVLGYVCQQYFLTNDVDGQTMDIEIYTTESINAFSEQTAAFRGKLKGFPLYTIVNMNQMGMQMTITSEVTNIEKQTIDDAKFSMEILDGYDELNQN